MEYVVQPCRSCGWRSARRICERCAAATNADLCALPDLYARLGTVLAPGSATGARVSGSKMPPLPARLEPLSLRALGGIQGVLADWEDDWRDVLCWSPTPFRGTAEQRVAGGVKFLRNNWPWAIDDHQVPELFAAEIRQLVIACRTQVEGPGDARPIGRCPVIVADELPCDTRLWADPYVREIRCRGCGTIWPDTKWLSLAAAIHG